MQTSGSLLVMRKRLEFLGHWQTDSTLKEIKESRKKNVAYYHFLDLCWMFLGDEIWVLSRLKLLEYLQTFPVN